MVLTLKYSNLTSAISESSKLANKLGQYCDDLSKKVQQKMYSVDGGTSSALNSADYYVNQKINQLRIRECNAQNLALRTQTLLDTAKRVDGEVKEMIEANQRSFFKKNPDLKPSKRKLGVISFLSGNLKNVPVLGWIIKGGEKVLGAVATLCSSIKDWLASGGWIVVLAAIGLAVLAVLTGGLIAVICVGLLIGLVSQSVSDIMGGKMSSWESYVGSAIGGAAGTVYGVYSGDWTKSGAIMSGVSSFTTGALEIVTGKRDRTLASFVVVSLEAGISAGVSWCIGKTLGLVSKTPIAQKLTSSADSWLAKIFRGSGAKGGVLIGRGSMLGSFRGQMTKLVTGSTSRITETTIKNAVVSIAWESFKKGISNKAENHITELVEKNITNPLIDRAKKVPSIAPVFEWQKTIPNPKEAKIVIDVVRQSLGNANYHQLAPAI